MTNTIVHITNFPSRPITDGGTHREEALARFIGSNGGVRLIVQDESFNRSKMGRLRRLGRLLREIRALKPELVMLNYPAYPFFWQHKITAYSLISLVFANRLRQLSRNRFSIMIDVTDLPVFQHADLGYKLEMSERTLRRIDKFFFLRADFLWVCSESIAQVIRQEYGIDPLGLIVALNGHDMDFQPRTDREPGPVKFAYAGSLNPERGVQDALDAFLKSGVDAELHLCGPYGDWLIDRADGYKLHYHGALTDEEAFEVLSGCDVGLIPYPERGYYHLAFATKLSFYLALGLPVLCSEARETASHVRRLGVGTCAPMACFADAFREIVASPERLQSWRKNVLAVRSDFSWNAIYSRALNETRLRLQARGRV